MSSIPTTHIVRLVSPSVSTSLHSLTSHRHQLLQAALHSLPTTKTNLTTKAPPRQRKDRRKIPTFSLITDPFIVQPSRRYLLRRSRHYGDTFFDLYINRETALFSIHFNLDITPTHRLKTPHLLPKCNFRTSSWLRPSPWLLPKTPPAAKQPQRQP